MENSRKRRRVRDIVTHLQTLPQDMEVRILVENPFSGEKAFYKIDDIEIHEVGEEVPDRPWTNKVVVIKAEV